MIRAESPASDPFPTTSATDPTFSMQEIDRVQLLGTLVGPDGRVAFLRGTDGSVEQVIPGDIFGSGVVARVNEGSILMDHDGEVETVYLNDRFGT